ncbi:MAG: hypothetical protein WCG51_06255, partial [Elusimicrobiota bacterium]
MDKRNERTALLAGLVAGVWLIVDFVLVQITQLRVLPALLPYSALTLVIAGVVYFRERFNRRVDEDKRDAALAVTERVSGSIFDEPETGELFSIAQTRHQFERFVVPAVTPLLATGLAIWVWSLYRQLHQPAAIPEQH